MPLLHRTDRMTPAVNNLTEQADFQKSYQALLGRYGLDGRKIQTGRETKTATSNSGTIGSGVPWSRLLHGSRDFWG